MTGTVWRLSQSHDRGYIAGHSSSIYFGKRFGLRVINKNRIILISILFAAFGAGLALRAMLHQPQISDIEGALQSVLANDSIGTVKIDGAPEFHILPSPELVLNNAKITARDGVMLSAGKMRFGIPLSSLLSGSYRISSINLDDVEATLSGPKTVTDNHTAEGLLIAFVDFFDRAQDHTASDSIDTITVSHGKFHYGRTPNLLTLNASTAMLRRTFGGSLSLSAQLDSGDRAMSVEMSVAPRENINTQGRSTEFSIRSDAMTLTGEGATAFDSNLQFLGTIEFKTKDLKSLNTILPTPIAGLPQSSGRLTAKARLSFSAVTLSEMRATIGASDITGNVIADFATATPRLTGTLAASTLDITDFLTNIGVKRDALGNWSSEPLPGNIVPDLDLDMRLSAETVTVHEVAMNSVALSTLIRNHKAELTLVAANLFDGSISGKIQIAADPHIRRYNIVSTITIDAIDLEKAGIALLDSKRVSGIMSGRVVLDTSGASSADMIKALAGEVDMSTDANMISGLDLLSFLHRVETRPVGAVLSIRSGKTVFDQGRIIMKIENGAGQFQTAKLTKYPDLEVRLAGKIDFANRLFALTGHALGSSAIASDRSIDLPFSLHGPFGDPDFVPDFTNVAKQSDAVSP